MSQDTQIAYLQGTPSAGATVNGNGTPVLVDGFSQGTVVEVNETAGGTCTLALAGSFDGTTWYAVGYQRIDNTAAPARAVANLSITASLKQVYQILDAYPQLRAVVSSVAGGCSVTVRAYCVTL